MQGSNVIYCKLYRKIYDYRFILKKKSEIALDRKQNFKNRNKRILQIRPSCRAEKDEP